MISTLFLQYFAVGFIIILGLVFGLLLGFIAPEELKPFHKYIIIIKRVLFIFFFILFIVFNHNSFLRFIAAIILLFYLHRSIKQTFSTNSYYLQYTAFGLFLGFVNTPEIMFLSVPAFMIGMPTALLNRHRQLGVYVKIAIVFIVFYSLSALLNLHFV